MDDYTWKQRLEERKKRQHLEIGGILLAVVLIAGFCLWHFFYAATPEYSLKQLSAAIQNHDTATINRYVNMEEVTSHAYDDLTRDLFAYDKNLPDNTKVMFEMFYVKIKPQVVDATCQLIDEAIIAGEWKAPQGDNILKGRQLGIDYEYLIEKSQLRNTEFVSIEDVEHSKGNQAIASIKVKDTYTQTTYTLKLLMELADSGDWQVVSITNYRDYLALLDPIQNGDINSYVQTTKNIIDKYNNIFETQRQRFIQLTKSDSGNMSDKSKQLLSAYISSDIIPALKARQRELDDIPTISGAAYLIELRKKSTDHSIQCWQHYKLGLDTNSKNEATSEFEASESYHKEALDYDRRIDDILKHTAINQVMPQIP